MSHPPLPPRRGLGHDNSHPINCCKYGDVWAKVTIPPSKKVKSDLKLLITFSLVMQITILLIDFLSMSQISHIFTRTR